MAEKKSVRSVIISGCPDADMSFIRSCINSDDFIICADNGYNYAKQLDIVPDLVVGDFDSYNGVLPETEIITLQTHKDDTDTAHCAKFAIEQGFGEVVLFGALGGRSDHTFANFCVLQFLNENGVKGTIIDKNETVEFCSEGLYEFRNQNGKTFSVFPFSCDEAVVSYYGKCEYPADKLTLKASLAMGVSNIFRSDNVKIEVIKGKVLIFTENI